MFKRRVWLRRLILIVLILIGSGVAIIIISRRKGGPNHYQIRLAHPAAYAHSPYWSTDFVNEQFAADTMWHLGADGMWHLGDFTGHWYNIRNGLRVTTNQPTVYKHTIWLFGSSQIYNAETPDDDTVASDLQRLMPDVRVVNLGIYAAPIPVQFTRLKLTPVEPGDTVIFFSGVQDVLNSTVPTAVLENIRLYAQDHDLRFAHVLLPHLWTKPLSAYEQAIADNDTITLPDVRDKLLSTWPDMERMTASLAQEGVISLDLTHVYDAVRETQEIYLDYVHVNEVGNKLVAQRLFEALAQ
ncbi:MAG: hypothetical protein ABI947_00145 [Chloroflexota bacterium]